MEVVPDPIGDVIARVPAMRAGLWDGVTAEEAESGVAAARANLTSGFAGRSLGFGLIKARPLYDGGDWQEAVIAISDGERDGAIVASLNGSQVGVAKNREEDPMKVLLDRLRNMAISNDASHFDQIALAEPIRF